MPPANDVDARPVRARLRLRAAGSPKRGLPPARGSEVVLRRLATLVLMTLALACGRTRERMPPEAPRLITDAAAVPGAVGELVTLEGELVAAKQQTVLGVDVDGEPARDGRRVRVTGVLRRTVVEPRPPPADGEWEATRGPGTYYSLVDPDTGALARPVPIE